MLRRTNRKGPAVVIGSHVRHVARWPAVVMVQPAAGIGRVPLRGMIEGLARCLVEKHGDDVLVMDVERGSEPHDVEPGPGPHRLVVDVPDAPVLAGAAVVAALNAHALKHAYTLIDASALGRDSIDALVAFVGGAELDQRLSRRLARLTRTAPGTRPAVEEIKTLPAGWTVVRTELLAPSVAGSLGAAELARHAVRRLRERFGRRPTETCGEPHPDRTEKPSVRRPEEVRVRLSFSDTAEDTSTDVGGDFSRWARALTGRRVGLALGGSGAWGYAHAALIDALEEKGMPIDLITSASSGSVIAAYYSVLGASGTERAIERGWRLEWAVKAATLSSALLELAVAADTGFPTLDQLEVMFYPVVTNLSTMDTEFITHASVPWGVRASSTAPGFFGSTVTSDAIYVDGAVTENVPARLAHHLGANLVIATNPLPPPSVLPPSRFFSRTLYELNPFFRLDQFMASIELMFHSVGDEEAEGYICYDPPPSSFPLFGTFDFKKARSIYENVRREAEFQATIDKAQKRWDRLAKARTGAV